MDLIDLVMGPATDQMVQDPDRVDRAEDLVGREGRVVLAKVQVARRDHRNLTDS